MNKLTLIFVVLFFFVKDTVVAPLPKKLIYADLPYIKCQVCEKTVSELYDQLETERAKHSKRKIDELKILDAIDGLCNPKKPNGKWLEKQDVKQITDEKGDSYLVVQEQEGISKCNEECVTVARSCEILLEEDTDRDEFYAIFHKNKLTKEEMVNKICKDISGRCNTKDKKLSEEYKRGDVEFVPLTQNELEAEAQAKKIKGFEEGATNGMLLTGRNPDGSLVFKRDTEEYPPAEPDEDEEEEKKKKEEEDKKKQEEEDKQRQLEDSMKSEF